jgi:hypothetical protein
MKRIYIATVGACLLGLLLPSTGMAAKADGKKAKLIAKYDKNKDGTLDADEMDSLRKDFDADKEGNLKTYDKNKDGKLSDEEINAIKPGASKKPKAEADGKKAKKGKKEKKAKSESPDKAKKGSDSGQSDDEQAPREAE